MCLLVEFPATERKWLGCLWLLVWRADSSQRQLESQGRAIVGIVSGGGRMDKPVLKAGQRPSLSF